MRNKMALAMAAGLGVAAIIAVPVFAAGSSGKLMHMTVHMTMSMPGGPTMAPRTIEHDTCMPAGAFDPDAIQRATSRSKDMECHVTNLHRSGSNISYDAVCTGRESIRLHADARIEGDDAFSGKSHVTMDAGGHAMTMDSDYTGKRIGSCTYTPPSVR